MRDMVIKLGNSIFENSSILLSIFNLFLEQSYRNKNKIIVICGGGSRVDAIRQDYKIKANSILKNRSIESEFHWKSINAMDLNTQEIYDKTIELLRPKHPNINDIFQITSDFNFLNKIRNGIVLFQPLKYLKENDILNHSWEISSDSITLFIGFNLGINPVILLKDCSYLEYDNIQYARIDTKYLLTIMENSGYLGNLNEHLGKGTIFPVDPQIPNLIEKFHTNIVILNGKDMNKLKSFMKFYPVMEIFDFPNFGTLISE